MSALDAASGKVLWRTAYAAPFEMNSAAKVHGPGPSRRRCSPTAACMPSA